MTNEKNIKATNRKNNMDRFLPPIPLMSPDELRNIIDHLGFSSQAELSRWLDHEEGSRVVRRWASGEVGVPPSVAILLRLLVRSQVHVGWAREQALRPVEVKCSNPWPDRPPA